MLRNILSLILVILTIGFDYKRLLIINAVSGLSASQPITVEANNVALTPGHEFALKCNINEFPDEKFTWFRIRQYSKNQTSSSSSSSSSNSERNEEELKQIDDKYIIQNNVIIVKSPTFADVGDYYCRVKFPHDGVESEKMIFVRPKPYIYDFNIESSTFKSAIIEEGKTLILPCNVFDEFTLDSDLDVSWHMSKFDENNMNDVINGEDGIRTVKYNDTSYALIIDKVTKDHRRYYKCQVSNKITENSKIILIRVKDKYTALWPTFGIVIELVILIGVICIVENRRIEPDKDMNDLKAIQM